MQFLFLLAWQARAAIKTHICLFKYFPFYHHPLTKNKINKIQSKTKQIYIFGNIGSPLRLQPKLIKTFQLSKQYKKSTIGLASRLAPAFAG